jgi:hypothetical protein
MQVNTLCKPNLKVLQSLASGARHNEHTPTLNRGTKVLRSNSCPFRIEPEYGKIGKHVPE